MSNEATKPVVVELSIEFIVELLLFLYPYGADQMGIPHNFWLGLVCWIVGTIIAIRMFWIFPARSRRLSRKAKSAISVCGVGVFVWIFYGPVVAAHSKWVAEHKPIESVAALSASAIQTIPPHLSVSSEKLIFKNQSVGTTSAPQTITVTNRGSLGGTLSAIATNGEFSQTNDCPASLKVGDSCDIAVIFAPQKIGLTSGSVDISWSQQLVNDKYVTTVVLSGSGRAVKHIQAAARSTQPPLPTTTTSAKSAVDAPPVDTPNVSSSLSGVTIDTSGLPGVVGVAGCGTGDCGISNVKVKGYGNGGVGVMSRGDGFRARNITATPGESPENESNEPIQLFDSSTGKTSNHKLEVNRRTDGLTQQQAVDIAVAALKRFVSAHQRMPNNEELAKELGEQTGNMWVNVDCEGRGIGIDNTGKSSFEDVTINQTSCDTGIKNSADGAEFKGVRITTSGGPN